MSQHEHNFPPDTQDEQKNRPFHLLLLTNNDQNWSRAVQHAASALGDVSLQETSSADEAISRLVVGDPIYSHLLVESGCADEQISELAKLTQGESHNATTLVMLGSGGRNPPRASVVKMANIQALTQAIMSREAAERAEMAPLRLDELQTALTQSYLQTRYQPIVRFSDRIPVALEVLARLDHPVHGTLAPDHFIPQMERAGLSRRLTEEVVRRAFSDHADYLKQLDLRFGLNFPLDTLIDGEMLQWLDEERQAFGIATDKITIELTESQPVADLKDADFKALGREIARLRDLGYAVALDDVSPEMKNHTSLFDFNFTSVKLDKELVFKSAYDPLAQLFVSETIALAQQAGFLVVAEGVRDPETWQRLRLAGADYAQGFMVARPLPAAAVPVWMGAWTAQR